MFSVQFLYVWNEYIISHMLCFVVEKWRYIGCYKDAAQRDLTSAHETEADDYMTLEWCYNYCDGYKSMYMALQEG